MLSEEEIIVVMALQKSPGIGDIKAKKLIRKCGSPLGLYKEKKTSLQKIEGISKSILNDLFSKNIMQAAESELQYIKSNGIDYSYFEDECYPMRLKHCPDGPVLLFQKGNINLKDQPVISIVGTRQITAHGKDICRELVEKLAPFNPVIVSGFAYGTDITAQVAALENNLQTIGCLAHGFNRLYPSVHGKYLQPIMEFGGFYTDFWSTDDFIRNNFLKRNRIIAGVSEATIVIESAARGGSLVTADIANSYNRDVFAVPGRPSDLFSEGCNDLIKQQAAHLLSKAEDIPYILGWRMGENNKAVQTKLFEPLNESERHIHKVISEQGKIHLDALSIKTGISISDLVVILFELEMKGLVRPLAGKFFEAL